MGCHLSRSATPGGVRERTAARYRAELNAENHVFLGCKAMPLDEDSAGVPLRDINGHEWEICEIDISHLKLGKEPPEREFKTLHCTIRIPQGVHASNVFGKLHKVLYIGAYDERTSTMEVGTEIAAKITPNGLAVESSMKLKTLLSEGQGRCGFSYFLPCLNLGIGGKVGHQSFPFVKNLILGAMVHGCISVETLNEGGIDAAADISFDLNFEEGEAKVGVGMTAKKSAPGKVFCTEVFQNGGPEIYPAQHQGHNFHDFIRFVDNTWRKNTMVTPLSWEVQRIVVKKPDSEEEVRDQMLLTPHIVVLGHMGAGKSAFLNAVQGWKQDSCGIDEFATGNLSTRVTTEPRTIFANVDHEGVQIPLRLTDCPGFNDPLASDESTASQLLTHLQKPDNCNVHAIVLVEKYGNPRFMKSHIKFLEAMEHAFGDKLFDCFMVVLTHFEFPSLDDEVAAKVKAKRDADAMKLQWRNILSQHFEAAERRFGQSKNMVFCLDSKVAFCSDANLEAQADGTGAVSKGSGVTKQRLKEFSEGQLAALMTQVVARAKSGKHFSHSLAPVKEQPQPPADLHPPVEEQPQVVQVVDSMMETFEEAKTMFFGWADSRSRPEVDKSGPPSPPDANSRRAFEI